MRHPLINLSKLFLNICFILVLGLSQIGGCGGDNGDDTTNNENPDSSQPNNPPSTPEIDYMGTWSGATDQGKAFIFVVEELSSYDVTEIKYFVDLNGNVCAEEISGTIDNIMIPLTNQECVVSSGPGDFSIEFHIYFDSAIQCHGTWSATDINCEANNSGSFSASKNVTCSDEDEDGYYAEDDCGTKADCDDDDPGLYPELRELEVCPSGCEYSSIQSAIEAASCENTILVAAGTYYEHINYLGKNITLRSENGPAVTIIDGNASGSVVSFTHGEGADSVLDGFTITNGSGTLTGYYTLGGGIYCKSSSPTISNCIISGNTASNGGGIYCYNYAFSIAPVYITNCSISGNTSTKTGGGIYCSYSNPTLTNCIISGNLAESNGAGGIFCRSSNPLIVNCTISGNLATSRGGGIYFLGCSAVMVNSICWGNAAQIIGDNMSIFLSDSSFDINYSAIEGGWSGLGNIGAEPEPDNPLFVDPQAATSAPTTLGDYHLQSGSPCIDAGDPASAFPDFPVDDIDDQARPQGAFYDMGADEF
jgi:parallel beta-helix repeat protein/predicted outer membrane repeat protein